jgi:hypothetical protein
MLPEASGIAQHVEARTPPAARKFQVQRLGSVWDSPKLGIMGLTEAGIDGIQGLG